MRTASRIALCTCRTLARPSRQASAAIDTRRSFISLIAASVGAGEGGGVLQHAPEEALLVILPGDAEPVGAALEQLAKRGTLRLGGFGARDEPAVFVVQAAVTALGIVTGRLQLTHPLDQLGHGSAGCVGVVARRALAIPVVDGAAVR